MGTRNLFCISSNGIIKVANYCQWGGWITAEGNQVVEFIIKYINTQDGFMFKDKVDKLSFYTDDEIKKIEQDDINEHPELSRETGSKILQYIYNGEVIKTVNSFDFGYKSLHCEFATVIDLDTNILEIYIGFNKIPLDSIERWYKNKGIDDYGYYGIKLLRKIPFDKLRNDTMKKLENELQEK
jgi:hypothetical protein